MLSQLTNLKSDPLDVLLFAVGLRLTQLAKMGDTKFKSLLDNRNFTIQMGSEAESTARYFSVNNGVFSQHAGEATNPSLTITFKDSMTGVKLLTKGDATAFMMGIQNGDLKMSGDYSLLMWFNQVAKYIVPKVPEQLQPVVDQAKPLLVKAAPIAKDLFAKVQSMLGGKENKASEGTSKYFKDVKENDKATDETSDGMMDNLKSKVQDVTETIHEKLDELGGEAKEKFEDLKETAEEKLDVTLDDTKEKLAEARDEAEEKLDDVKAKAETKLEAVQQEAADKAIDAKVKLDEVKDNAADKVADLKHKAEDKMAEVKDETVHKVDDTKAKLDDAKEAVADKATELKDKAEDKLADVKDEAAYKVDDAKVKLDAVKDTAADKATELKDKAEDKLDENKQQVNQKAEEVRDNVEDKLATTANTVEDKLEAFRAQQTSNATTQSQKIEAKHANDEVIAKDVETSAVKDDESPITNITVTRHEDKADNKSTSDSNSFESGKPAIVVQDKDGKSYTSK